VHAVDVSEVLIHGLVPTHANGLSARSTPLHVSPTPVFLVELVVQVALVGNRHSWEDLIRDEAVRLLEVSDTDVRERNVNVQIAGSGVRHFSVFLSQPIRSMSRTETSWF